MACICCIMPTHSIKNLMMFVCQWHRLSITASDIANRERDQDRTNQGEERELYLCSRNTHTLTCALYSAFDCFCLVFCRTPHAIGLIISLHSLLSHYIFIGPVCEFLFIPSAFLLIICVFFSFYHCVPNGFIHFNPNKYVTETRNKKQTSKHISVSSPS